ncbi:MAG: hypothetical protein U0841_15035 [Chloroflexia bacterium]
MASISRCNFPGGISPHAAAPTLKCPSFPPVLAANIPVADDLHVQFAADGAQAGRQREPHARLAIRPQQAVAAPLQGEGAQARCQGIVPPFLRHIPEPERPRIARTSIERCALARADQHVGGIVRAPDRAIPIEERLDLAGQQAGSAAERAHRAPDQVERNGVGIQVDRLADLADAEDLRRPVADLLDADQPGIEVRQDALTRPAGIGPRERQLADLLLVRHTDLLPLLAQQRVDRPPLLARHMAIRQRVDAITIGHHAGQGGHTLLPWTSASTG